MIVYWLMFFAPVLLLVVTQDMPGRQNMAWVIIFLALTLLIGFRYEVGGDWDNYLRHLESASDMTLLEAMQVFDPAHGMVNWLAAHLQLQIFAPNLLYGAIFSLGLCLFCRSQPRPYLALAIAIPYLVIVVAMGYSRQGVAIGLAMMGLVALEKNELAKFILLIGLAAMFHLTAIVLLPVAVFSATQRRLRTILIVVLSFALLYSQLAMEAASKLYENFILAEYSSQGGMVRVAMIALPAILFLILHRRFSLSLQQRKLWLWMSFVSLAFIPAYFLIPSSAAVDRVALYFIPIQLFVFSRIPDILQRPRQAPPIMLAVIAYYGIVQYVWLNFAIHSRHWVPFRVFPLLS